MRFTVVQPCLLDLRMVVWALSSIFVRRIKLFYRIYLVVTNFLVCYLYSYH